MISRLLMLFFLLTSPLFAEEEKGFNFQQFESTVESALDGQFTKVMGAIDEQIGNLEGLIESKASAPLIKEAISSIDSQIATFGTMLKGALQVENREKVDTLVSAVRTNLDLLEGYVTDDNVKMAKTELLSLTKNWKSLAATYQDGFGQQGWLRGVLDTGVNWIYDWWYGE